MSAQINPPSKRQSNWLKPLLIFIAVILLLVTIGVASVIGLGFVGWNFLEKHVTAYTEQPYKFSADELAIIDMVVEREMNDSTGTAETGYDTTSPKLDRVTKLLAAQYQRSMTHYANGGGGDGSIPEPSAVKQALALIASQALINKNPNADSSANMLPPEIELLLEAAVAHQQHNENVRANAVDPAGQPLTVEEQALLDALLKSN